MASRKARRGPAFVLASMVASYPDEGYAESVGCLLQDEDLTSGLSEQVLARLEILRMEAVKVISDPVLLDDLRSEYIDTFDRGRQANPLYETEFGRSRVVVKGSELADIAAFYRAFGLEVSASGDYVEMLDHVSVELEFYALLLLKDALLRDQGDAEGVSVVEDARRKFLKEHLARFVGAIGERPGVVNSLFYSAAFAFCRDLVLEECANLGVEPEAVSWIGGAAEPADVTCGGSVGCVK